MVKCKKFFVISLFLISALINLSLDILLIPNNEWKPDNIERLKTTFKKLGLNWSVNKSDNREIGIVSRKSQGGRRRTRKNKRKVRRRRGKKTKKR